MAPMHPDDLDVLSRPVTYVTWQAAATDGKTHEVTAMLAVGSDIVVNVQSESVIARREKFGELTALAIGSEAQPILQSKGDDHRINWGFLYLAAPHASGAAIADMQLFSDPSKLPAADDTR